MYRFNGTRSSPVATHPARARGRRRDDVTFIAIAALLGILFATQVGWVVAQQAHPQTTVSRP